MGMAGGAYKADKDRAERALRARQMANQANQANQAAALRARELDMRERARQDALAQQAEENDYRRMQSDREFDLRQQKQQADIAHQERRDALLERAQGNMRADRELAAKMKQQADVFSGYAQLGQRERAQREQRQAQGASAVASVLKLAGMQGKDEKQRGVVPMYALQALNRDMGFDGQNQGFVQGGYTSNGDFFLTYAQRDPQSGQMVTRDQILSPIDQFKIMHQQPGIFNDADRGNQAGILKKMGYRDNEILLASGLDQTKLEQMQKLMAKQQSGQSGMKDQLAGLKMLQDYIEKERANLGSEDLATFEGAVAAGMKNLASQFAPQAPKPGVNMPQVSEDGNTLQLPKGVKLQKDQEYTENGKKYIWRGGDVKNFEIVGGDGGGQNQQGQQSQKPLNDLEKGKLNNDAFDALNPEGAPGRDVKLAAQGGYQVEDTSQIEGVGPRVSNLPEGQEPGATVKPPETPPSGGMAAGAAGAAGGAAPAVGNQKMFDSLKRQGAIDKDLTFEQFCKMLEEEQPEEEPPPEELPPPPAE